MTEAGDSDATFRGNVVLLKTLISDFKPPGVRESEPLLF